MHSVFKFFSTCLSRLQGVGKDFPEDAFLPLRSLLSMVSFLIYWAHQHQAGAGHGRVNVAQERGTKALRDEAE